MNFELTDEQLFLRDAAKDALSRTRTVEAAREVLDGGERPDLWPTATTAGWTGLLVSEERGGAGLGALEALLVLQECGRVLASVELLGHLPASALLDAGGHEATERVAAGEVRAAYLPTRPPDDLGSSWTTQPLRGARREGAPRFDGSRVTGAAHWVPDATGADLLVGVALADDDTPVAFAVEASADGVTVEDAERFDGTRRLGHVRLEGAAAAALEGVAQRDLAAAWYLAQALLAAEGLGAVEETLERAVQYAKERFTFGRQIGSYQAVKHALVEVLRQKENVLSLLYYTGWARQDAPEEFPVAASALRVASGKAVDVATRTCIAVHGGIGATWEHDAPLFFRRAQLSRRLLGGIGDASDRVGGLLIQQARAGGDLGPGLETAKAGEAPSGGATSVAVETA